jgi:hypothetical protein
MGWSWLGVVLSRIALTFLKQAVRVFNARLVCAEAEARKLLLFHRVPAEPRLACKPLEDALDDLEFFWLQR